MRQKGLICETSLILLAYTGKHHAVLSLVIPSLVNGGMGIFLTTARILRENYIEGKLTVCLGTMTQWKSEELCRHEK